MAAKIKQIVYSCMSAQETLRMLHRFESAHDSLSNSCAWWIGS